MSHKRILVVDDHAASRTFVRATLRTDKTGSFEVVEAASGKGCLEAVATGGPFDLIFLDIEMPDIDGLAVCRMLRERGVTTPVVFLTARGEGKDYLAGRQAGGDSYLAKPPARQAILAMANLFTNVSRRTGP